MRQALLLLREDSGERLEFALKHWIEGRLELGSVEQVRVCPVPEPPVYSHEYTAWVARTFSRASRFIETETAQDSPAALRELVVLVEVYDREAWDWESPGPLGGSDGAPVTSLVSMLILAFPEIHWVLYSPLLASSDRWMVDAHLLNPADLSRMGTLLRNAYVPLFDASGLRELVRSWLRTDRSAGRPICDYLPTRTGEAAAVDEEIGYAYFNAYLPYRLGYRCWAVHTLGMMEWALREKPPRTRPLEIALEDVFLWFPDRSAGQSLSVIEERHARYSALGQARQTVLITFGTEATRESRRKTARDRAYLKRRGRPYQILYKPLTGLFESCSAAGLRKKLAWPPEELSEIEPGAHSAPGRLLAIAETLLARARRILGSCATVEDAIHAAVLALDAKELLGGRTPTLALEAVALQHEAEVTAESLFLGVQHNLNVRHRLRDVSQEVAFVADAFRGVRRKRVVLNGRLSIVERLARRYAQFHRVEEELACLSEARTLRFGFWVRERPLRWMFWPFLRYIAFALSSLPRFAAVIVAWTVLFGLSYHVLAALPGMQHHGFAEAMLAAAKFFVTLESAPGWGPANPDPVSLQMLWNAWLTLQGFIGLTNFGLLISHLYLLAFRR